MKLKILAVAIMLIVICSTFVASASVKQNENIESNSTDDIIDIRVAVLSIKDVYGLDTEYFLNVLEGYRWIVGETLYKVTTTVVFDEDIFKEKLNTDDYDLLLVPGIVGFNEAIMHYYPSIKNWIWKEKIADFVKDGGGYIGHCGGASMILELDNKPTTILEKVYDKSCIDITRVKGFLEGGTPILDQLMGLKPEKIGQPAYFFFSGWNESDIRCWRTGANLDIRLNTSHPIFDDFLESTRCINWVSGPALIVPDELSSDVSVVARFPEEEISDNETYQVHVWKYTGRLVGLLRGFFNSLRTNKNLFEALYLSAFKAQDWEMTNEIVQTHVANKGFMTTESYPNENKGRVVLCSGHPEFPVWSGGHIEEHEDTNYNNLYDGLHYWADITPFEETLVDEETYDWWIVRREVAWAAKVPDNDFPPVYDSSQVSDIYPYEQSTVFSITGNVETSGGIISLDLYYRYRDDNESCWSNWTLYETDMDDSDGWSWEFNASDANETGFYQFYSIRNVEYEGYTETEKVPPGADATVHVSGLI